MKTYLISGNKAHVYFDEDRFNWKCEPFIAIWDSYDGAPIDFDTPSNDPIGLGHTEHEAIHHLLEQSI